MTLLNTDQLLVSTSGLFLGRFDIVNSASAMICVNVLPREENLKAGKRIVLSQDISKGEKVIFNISYLECSLYPLEDHSSWLELYPYSAEDISEDLPPIKCPKFRVTFYVDSDHAYDLLTRRYLTGILVMLNNRHIRWISKCIILPSDQTEIKYEIENRKFSIIPIKKKKEQESNSL
jgi:hypothetical protein